MSTLRALRFPALILLIILGFYWKLTFTHQYDWLWGPDLTQQILPWLDEEARQFQHHQLPLWDPHEWTGQSLIGQAQPGVAYPLNWLLWLIPRRNGHIQIGSLQAYYITIHFMAAFFAYWLCRDLGRSRIASLLAGLIFSLAGFVGNTDWPQMINGAVWTPLVFLFLLRAERGVRPWSNSALSGLCLGMAWLSGHHQIPILLSLAAVGTWIWVIASRRGRVQWAVLSLAIAGLVGALQILPAQEYGRLSLRWVGAENPVGWHDAVPYSVHANFSLSPIQLLGVVIPGISAHFDPYVGLIALSLALLGMILAWQERSIKLFAALGIAGLLFALGRFSVFQGVLYGVVPFVEKARVPAAAVFLSQFAIAVLAAAAVDGIGRWPMGIWVRRFALGILGYGLLAGFIIFGVYVDKKMGWDVDDRIVITVLVAFMLGSLLFAWRNSAITSRTAGVLLLLLLLFELGNNAGFKLSSRSDPGHTVFRERIQGNADLAEWLHLQGGVFRVDIASEDDLAVNWPIYHNLDAMHTYAGVTANTFQIEYGTWQSRMLLGTRFTIGKAPVDPSEKEAYNGKSGLKVFENPDAFPRAWSVHELVRADTEQGRQLVSGHLPELRNKAFLNQQIPSIPACSDTGDTVSVTQYGASSIDLRSDLKCDGMVVLSDAYYPGWKAIVDGNPAQIYEVDFALRGVLVPKGTHTIAYRYRPWSVYLGALLSLAGVLATIIIYRREPA